MSNEILCWTIGGIWTAILMILFFIEDYKDENKKK